MKIRVLLSFLFVFIVSALSAQSITIKGRVVDENNEALESAVVIEKGTANGTVTDEQGNYSLVVPNTAKAIVVKYVGYDEREFEISTAKGDLTIDVKMGVTTNSLNEVVVSASKKQEKILDAPASISVLGGEKLSKAVVTTPVDLLKTTPGVDIMRTGLVSSNVVVRGFNNIFSGSVLNVIDNRIGAVPSLRVNAYQLVPTSNLDIDRIEVVRGPASALYGPNASSGVVHIMTKDPLQQKKKFETTVAMTSGFTVLDQSYKGFNGGNLISGNIINPELRHSGKLWDGKFGYKVSGSYFQGDDYPNYDPREPYDGDSVVFGSVINGQIFRPDTLGYSVDANGKIIDSTLRLDIQRFKKNFKIQKFSFDGRIDIQPIKDITITVNGGVAQSRNVELTGLGAGQARGWLYWYVQARFKWKKLFVQYFINSSDAKGTYLIPQLSASARNDYNSASPPDPYQIQRLVDKSKVHVAQIQHSWNPLKNLGFIYGADVLATLPNTDGTINGRFEKEDNLIQTGAYLQGDYEPLKWFKIVAAIRVDYNTVINNVVASPRAALVFKPAPTHNIRLTYNRAFDSPTTLNQFLDLSNGLIPNGINIRGIGNPNGYNYRRNSDGSVQFSTAPWDGAPQWNTFGDKSSNYVYLDKVLDYLSNEFAKATGQNVLAIKSFIKTGMFKGIATDTGTVQNADHIAIDYANFATTGDFEGSKQDVSRVFKDDLKKINNSTTQTLELGYKGLFFGKLSVQVDGYWTRIDNYVSPLVVASGAVMLDWQDYIGDTTGLLYQNLKSGGGFLESTFAALDGRYTNENIIKKMDGTIYDDIIVLLNQFPAGTITPDNKNVNSDFILTYKNLGRLDIFGIDFGAQYNVVENERHLVQLGGSFSWMNKDQLKLSSGESVSLNAPKYKASAMFDHTLNKIGFGYGLSFRYQAGYYAQSAVYFGDVKPAYILDARVSYRPNFYKDLLLSVNVNNVNNYQWASFPGTPLMGTQFYVRAQVTF